MKSKRKYRIEAIIMVALMICMIFTPATVSAAGDTIYYECSRVHFEGHEYTAVRACDIDGNMNWDYYTGEYPITELNQTAALGSTSSGLLISTPDGIICLDKASGTIKWQNTAFKAGGALWIFDRNENLYIIGYYEHILYKFDKNGNLLVSGFLGDNFWPTSISIQDTGMLRIDFDNNGNPTYALINPETFDYMETEKGFSDIAPTDWYYDAVTTIDSLGYMTGMSQHLFGPAEKLSRAQFATILYRIESSILHYNKNEPYMGNFSDVEAGTWYSTPVAWASFYGIVTGYTNGTFGPADPITREQLAVMMYRFANHHKCDVSVKADISGYPDAGNVSDWAVEAMEWAVGNKIISGKNGGQYLDPSGNASRAECATILCNFIKQYGSLFDGNKQRIPVYGMTGVG